MSAVGAEHPRYERRKGLHVKTGEGIEGAVTGGFQVIGPTPLPNGKTAQRYVVSWPGGSVDIEITNRAHVDCPYFDPKDRDNTLVSIARAFTGEPTISIASGTLDRILSRAGFDVGPGVSRRY